MIESIEKLRDWSHRYDNSWIQRDGSIMFCTSNSQFAGDGENYGESIRSMIDEIEAEIAEKCIELPVDADGVPIRIGDLVTNPFFEGSRKVRSLTKEQGDPYWRLGVDEGEVTAHTCRHAKPRTVEDVLHDFARDVLSMNRNRFAESPDEIHIPDGAKYAAELREMMGGEL